MMEVYRAVFLTVAVLMTIRAGSLDGTFNPEDAKNQRGKYSTILACAFLIAVIATFVIENIFKA